MAARIVDGSTVQAGIGEVPDATTAGLLPRRGLRVWTEMFSDGVLALERAAPLDRDVPLTSFLFGSPELYAWLDGNARVEMRRTEVTNARRHRPPPRSTSSTPPSRSTCSPGQRARIKARIHSGFGGQTDFIVGAMHAPGGQAFIALRSWHPKADCSTIVPLVDEPVTSFQIPRWSPSRAWPRSTATTERTQARHLIEHAAHPRVREELWEEAVALGLA